MPKSYLDKVLPKQYVRLTTYCQTYEIPYRIAYSRCSLYNKVPYKRFGGTLCILKDTNPELFRTRDPIHGKTKFTDGTPKTIRQMLDELLKKTTSLPQ